VLAHGRGDFVCAFVSDARGLERAVRPARAALGPRVPWPVVARSFARAVRALETLPAAAGPGLTDTDEHLLALLLGADPALADDLAARRLAPLGDLDAETAARLTATLDAWLRYQGHQPVIAHELGVHRQTVRYRLAQLRERFGSALENPDARLELQLALQHVRRAAP